MTQAEIVEIIEAAAMRRGVSPDALLMIARIESNLDPNAQNPRSSAGGLFQFVDGTARDYGLSGRLRFDPEAAADAAARLAKANQRTLTNALGREPTPAELYLAHQQGGAGAAALLANPHLPAAQVLARFYNGDVNRAARAIELNGGNQSMTASAFSNLWIGKAEEALTRTPSPATHSQSAPRQAPVPAPLSQRPPSAAREAPVPAAMSPGLAVQRNAAPQSDIGLTGRPAGEAPTPATMSPELAARRAGSSAAPVPATMSEEVERERRGASAAPVPATMSASLAAQRAGAAAPAATPPAPAAERVNFAPAQAMAGTAQMAPGARPSIVDQAQARNQHVMPGVDPGTNDIGPGVSWVDFNSFVQNGSQVPKYLTETVRVPAPQPATMSAELAARRSATPATHAAEQQFTTMTVQRLNPEWTAAQPAPLITPPAPATMSPGLAAQRAATPASAPGLTAGLPVGPAGGAARPAPAPAPAPQRSSSSDASDHWSDTRAGQTISGSATGRSYDVGQVYEAGGYLYEAGADGGFTKVGKA